MVVALGVLLAVCPAAAQAMEVLSAEAGSDKEPGVYWLDASVLLDARPAALRHVINRLCDYRDDLPHVAYCRVFKVKADKSWSYAVVDPPILHPRDYVIVSTIADELQTDGSGTFKSLWKLTPHEGPAPRQGFIRLSHNEGSWILLPRDDGKRTELRYHIRCSPGGIIPAWAAGYVAKKTLPDSMQTLERIAQREEKQNAVKMPVAGQPWAGTRARALDNPLPPPGSEESPSLWFPPP
jgi:hypothetical protein